MLIVLKKMKYYNTNTLKRFDKIKLNTRYL